MGLKQTLLTQGYLPANLPPTFNTMALGIFLTEKTDWICKPIKKLRFRAAIYNASKRGFNRRIFSAIHPATAHDLSHFIEIYEQKFSEAFSSSTSSFSKPVHTPSGSRAISISSHSDLEKIRLELLSRFRFIVKTDISRFYHSIYTHSIPWAMHGKIASKADTRPESLTIFMNKLDFILRQGQDGQTIGIPVGPDCSRYIAELIAVAIDRKFRDNFPDEAICVVRHVDDIWIGTNSRDSAESALARYTQAIRDFELDINEAKTHIYSEDFQFFDEWPSILADKIEFAAASAGGRRSDKIRNALEHAFFLARTRSDEGILRYTLKYIDSFHHDDAELNLKLTEWKTIEPFLKRASVHFGHCIDYVMKIIVWRHISRSDVDVDIWAPLIIDLISQHAKLGNDSEVCWLLYGALRLGIEIPHKQATDVLDGCGVFAFLSLLISPMPWKISNDIFNGAFSKLEGENETGSLWPLFLEWKVNKWRNHHKIKIENELISELIKNSLSIINVEQLPAVFDGLTSSQFPGVVQAIETNTNEYPDEVTEDDVDEIFEEITEPEGDF